MKRIFVKWTIFLSIIFWTNLTLAQDMIILRTGDEIKSKVIEITPELVKYKKWENQDGPTYSSTKVEVFMIKYANGTKDVFKDTPAMNSTRTVISNTGDRFVGIWYDKRYDGNNNKTTITISKAGEGYLVDYNQMSRGGGFDSFYNTDGSFKEVGQFDKNSIVINIFIKLSLINETTLLMNSKEFYRHSQSQSSINSSSSTSAINPTGSGSIFTEGTIDTIVYHFDQNFVSVIVSVTKSSKDSLWCTGAGTKIYKNNELLSFINLNKGMRISFDGDLTERSEGIRFKPTRINIIKP